MNYTQARAFIDQAATKGSVYGLESIRELLRRLGNPQDTLKIVHIAGTNGKGSVLAYASTVLQTAGYTVGRYLSPALFSYRERIQVSGRCISEEALARHITVIQATCESMVADGLAHPTVFEIELALAYRYFVETRCDVVVQETGLGGRLDATNIVSRPLVTVITTISLDHTGLLGDTLAAIAGEKAGIIKEQTPVISSPQQPEALAVIAAQCRTHSAPLTIVQEALLTPVSDDKSGQVFDYKNHKGLKIALLGQHQLLNAATAIEALACLTQQGWLIKPQHLSQGLADTSWPGRFQRIHQAPDVVIDGAHNPDAAQRLSAAIQRYYPHNRRIFIMSVFADKDYPAIIAQTAPLADVIIAASTDNPRALSAQTLADAIRPVNNAVTAVPSLTDAVAQALDMADSNTAVFAFGSLSHLGQVTALVQQYFSPSQPQEASAHD